MVCLPAWRAFELLHSHAGDQRLKVSISNQTFTVSTAPVAPKWAVAVP